MTPLARCVRVFALASLCLATALQAATFRVTKTADTADGVCDSDCSLREAVMAFNLRALTGGSHVIDVPAGTYRLTLAGAAENLGATGDLDVVTLEETTLLEIRGAGRTATIIDGGGLDRVFQIVPQSVASDLTVTIRDLTVRGGRTPNLDFEDGGGIFNAGVLTLRRVTLEDNEVRSFSSDGGGLYNHGEATLVDCDVRNNRSRGVAGFGGGIFNEGTLTLVESTVRDNSVSGQDANGGGIASTDTLIVERSTVSANEAVGGPQFGGGIFATGSLEMVNSTVSGNSAGLAGGGLSLQDLSGTVTSSTLADNSAPQGSALHQEGDVAVTLHNTLVAGRCSAPFTSDGGNVESPGSTCGLGGGDLTDVSADELQLGALAANGGPTRTHALEAGSAAIDRGQNRRCPATDQRGHARPADGDGNATSVCDAGAYEAGGENGPPPPPPPPPPPGPGTNCTATATSLCLNGDRFRVSARWTTRDGSTGSGQGVELTQDTGYFWFFQASNVEMVVKLLRGCPNNGHFWVFAGGLSNVEIDLRVEDTVTGAVRTYRNPQSTPFQPIQDTSAFACN